MTPDQKGSLPLQMEKLFYDLQDRIYADVVRRVKKTGEITSTADYQINKLLILGNSTEFIEQEIKQLSQKSDQELWELYDKVSNWEYVRYKDAYQQINEHFVPLEENQQIRQWSDAVIEQTKGDIKNITQSLGFTVDMGGGKKAFTPLSHYYQKYLDRACMDIVTGAFDYNTVLRRVVKEMTASGLKYVDYASGYTCRAPVAVRRAIMTGVSQLTAQINEQVAKDLGADTYEVTWHAGHRPSHWWGGNIYTKAELISVCRLGDVEGLCGANCRHSYLAFIPGVSVRTYTPEQLRSLEEREQQTRNYQGKEYNAYEASQMQRKLETKMRSQRAYVKQLQQGGASEEDVIAARARYLNTLHQYQGFSKKMGIPEQMQRVYMDGLGRIVPGKAMPRVPQIRLADSTDKWAKEAKEELLKHEKSYSIRKNEITVVYDKNGRFLFQKAGSKNEVKFTRLEALRLKDSVVSHNHPSGGSFSMADIYFLKISEASEIRVVVDDGVYYMRQPQKWEKAISRKEDFMGELEKMRKEARKQYQKLYEDGKINKVDRFLLSQEAFAMKFAKKYGLDYGKEFF